MKLSMIFLLTLCALLTDGQMDGKMTLCGRNLANARQLFCYGLEKLQKRGDLDEASVEPFEQQEPAWPWGGRRAALGARWARNKRGLVDECCLKPCDVSELVSYC